MRTTAMATPQIRNIGVIGTGVIGSSWIARFLASGLRVTVTDPAPEAREKLAVYLEKQWPLLEKTGLSEGASIENYVFVDCIDEYLGGLDFVQENAPEHLEVKRNLFTHLDALTPKHTIIASSSSGLPSSQFVTECTHNPSRILIGHPFNPPHLVPLVEVVPHPGTAEVYIDRAMQFYRWLGKSPVLVKKETPGFIANRLQAAVMVEAYSLVKRGVISAEDLDTTMTTGPGLRWALTGPLMTNTLGGGGDFKHFVEHIGRATQAWMSDMDANRFQYTPENIDRLAGDVREWTDTVDMNALEAERDQYLVGLVRDKARSNYLK